MSAKKTKHTILGMLVKDANEGGTLRRACTAKLDSFFDTERLSKSGWEVHDPYDNVISSWNERYAFKDNDATILAVAHCDTVHEGFYPYVFDAKNLLVYTPELDDRIGVYIITSLLPRLGVKCDVLLTENEEWCSSTAKDFKTEKKYNWIMEWDRRGAGCVLYQYDTPELRNIMQKYDFKVEVGSYTDICDLHWLGVSGINFATGYTNEHTKTCYADLRCLAKQVVRFLRFYHDYKDIRLESNAGARRTYSTYGHRYWYDKYEDEDGYYDKDGKWHYYSYHTTPVHYPLLSQPTSATYDGLDWRKCVVCGRESSIRVSESRGRYVCPICRRTCPVCKEDYSILQMNEETGLCLRCQTSLNAYSVRKENYKTCCICKKETGCAELYNDTWVCGACVLNLFVVCDRCNEVMPSGSKTRMPSGVCEVCMNATTKNAPVMEVCEACNSVLPADKLRYFQDEDGSSYNLCYTCAVHLIGLDEANVSFDYPLEEDTETHEPSGFGDCDICGSRDMLFNDSDVFVCRNCRNHMHQKGA